MSLLTLTPQHYPHPPLSLLSDSLSPLLASTHLLPRRRGSASGAGHRRRHRSGIWSGTPMAAASGAGSGAGRRRRGLRPDPPLAYGICSGTPTTTETRSPHSGCIIPSPSPPSLHAADLKEFVKGTCRHPPASAGFVDWSGCTSR